MRAASWTKRRFLPLAIPITEPAVGYGAAGGLAFISKPLAEAQAGFGRPNITIVGGISLTDYRELLSATFGVAVAVGRCQSRVTDHSRSLYLTAVDDPQAGRLLSASANHIRFTMTAAENRQKDVGER